MRFRITPTEMHLHNIYENVFFKFFNIKSEFYLLIIRWRCISKNYEDFYIFSALKNS